MEYLVGAVAGTVLGFIIGFLVTGNKAKDQLKKVEDEAKRDSEAIKNRMISEARTEIAKLKADQAEDDLKRRQQFDKEIKVELDEKRVLEKKLDKREESLDRKLQMLERREGDLKSKEEEVVKSEEKRQTILKETEARKLEMEKLVDEERKKLASISNVTPEQAKQMLMQRIERDMATETAMLMQRAVMHAKQNAEGEARRIIINTVQRIANECTIENTTTSIELPSEDMKGRVIGKEGRNIRAFEKATGIDVVVDETPGLIILSGFEPVRREIARLAMVDLLHDGRIHPTRIEESVAKAEKEVTENIEKLGMDTAVKFGCPDLHPRLRSLLGRLRYRTSYGQNVLAHSMEVATICTMLAAELKLDPQIAKRCGLLHDCGKAVDQEQEGTHPQIGMDIASQCNERPEVLEAIGGHHGDIPITSLYTVLVQIADAISAARPGARRESLEKYIQRMKKLEEIATSKRGVDKAFAIQAGREVRVIAKADLLADVDCAIIAREIAKQIEDELSYPGEVRVTMIRESRFIEYAR